VATDSEAYEERRYEELHKLVAKGKLMMDKEVLPPMLRVFAYMCLPALKKALDAVAEEVGDVKVVCDEVSFEYLKGSTVDYAEEMIRSAFEVVKNPNAEQKCGCGVSFEAKF